MVCLCKSTLGPLQALMLSLQVDASASATVDASLQIQALASWLAQLGLPAAPWQPDEAWLDLTLPTISLSASAVATLQAFAQLNAGALALGLDLTVAAQANAFARLAATLDARLSAMLGAGVSLNPSAWCQASATMTACAQVQAALSLGVFTNFQAGASLSVWRPFLLQLRPLLPVIALSAQLGVSAGADLSLSLGAMVRAMLQISMPVMVNLSAMASLTAAMSAMASLSLSLGVNAGQIGLPAIQAMVSAQVSATASALAQATGSAVIDIAMPRLPYCPTLMAPPAVVQAAMSLNMPALSWQVPMVADVSVLAQGLPTMAFATSLSTALGVSAATSPCAVCDAGAVLSAALSVSV